MMFVGRKKELIELNRQYSSNDFHFTVIYGRRRIGKTELIKQFIMDKNSIYFMATESSGEKNLELLSMIVLQHSKTKFKFGRFESYEALFDFVSEISADERVVLVIDEFPYLAEAYPEISSILQKYCDNQWKDTRLQLILCGSSMSFMESQVLGVKSPLYGRRTSQIRLREFNYFETEEFLKPMKKVDIAVLHAVTGGVAEYLSYIDKGRDLESNLVSLFFVDKGRMYEEPPNYLKQELREPRLYNEILDVIARGARKNNEIATKVKKSTGAINNYLDNLIELGILIKEKPVGENASRKSIYRINNGSFRFWYRYVFPNMSAIEIGLGERLYEGDVKEDISNFMGEEFEGIFIDHFDMLNKEGKLPKLITSRGRWWGSNPKLKREEEIDLVGYGKNLAVFCEVKWTNKKVDMDILHKLVEKSMMFSEPEKHYILFSKSGFTKRLIDEAKDDGRIQLVSFL